MKSSNTVDDVAKFKQYLQGDEMWHGTVKFPLNESNEAAYKKCISHETAKLYCPVRWKSIMLWADVSGSSFVARALLGANLPLRKGSCWLPVI